MNPFDSVAVPLLNAAQLSQFGDTATYTPTGGLPVTIKGMLDTGPAGQSRDQGIAGSFWVRLADVPGLKKGDTLTVNGVEYRISKDPLDTKDGVGGTHLLLRTK